MLCSCLYDVLLVMEIILKCENHLLKSNGELDSDSNDTAKNGRICMIVVLFMIQIKLVKCLLTLTLDYLNYFKFKVSSKGFCPRKIARAI